MAEELIIELGKADRLRGLLEAADPKHEVRTAWHAKELVRSIYFQHDHATAVDYVNGLARDLQDRSCPPEIRQLGRTLKRWQTQISNWHRAHLTNGPTEAANNLIKRIKRGGFGFTNFINYRTRVLLYAGQPTVMQHVITALARDCPSWHDDLWVVDSTPVECGRSRETVKRSDLAGYASYGYCASHSRLFWGMRLHLVATPSGLPVAYALTSAKTGERDTALAMLHLDPALTNRGRHTLIADKGYRSAAFEAELDAIGISLIRPVVKSEKQTRTGQRYLKPFRQIIKSVNQTFKAQLDLERHGARKPAGLCARVLQRILALTAAIWHNETTNQTGPARSLIAYDH